MGVVLAGVAVIREVQFGEPREEPGNGELNASLLPVSTCPHDSALGFRLMLTDADEYEQLGASIPPSLLARGSPVHGLSVLIGSHWHQKNADTTNALAPEKFWP